MSFETLLIPMLHHFKRHGNGAILADLATMIESSHFQVVLDETGFSLEEAGEAHARLESGKAMGRIVVDV